MFSWTPSRSNSPNVVEQAHQLIHNRRVGSLDWVPATALRRYELGPITYRFLRGGRRRSRPMELLLIGVMASCFTSVLALVVAFFTARPRRTTPAAHLRARGIRSAQGTTVSPARRG